MRKYLLYIPTACILLVMFTFVGCKKEYSFEGTDAIINTDTTSGGGTPAGIRVCPACIGKNVPLLAEWNFYESNSFFCGVIDKAVVAPEKTAFTFFGPYSCHADSGIIISAYFDGKVLNKDWFNISTRNGAFYFYDNIGNTFAYISSSGNFTVTLESYIHQTRIATGTFNGPVTRANGTIAFISSGRFKVKLE